MQRSNTRVSLITSDKLLTFRAQTEEISTFDPKVVGDADLTVSRLFTTHPLATDATTFSLHERAKILRGSNQAGNLINATEMVVF